MRIISLPEHNRCTGCMACLSACPKHAISVSENEYGEEFPKIDESLCIRCGKCQKVCHLNNSFFPEKRAEEVYAAWSTDADTRRKSASGGIAAELYQFALKNGMHAFGVKLDKAHEAHYFEVQNKKDIEACQNSKYVFSKMGDTYASIARYLNAGENVLFIGLPCHVAGVRAYLGKEYENLLLVDIICHGTCSARYLKEHIHSIEEKKNEEAETVFFRDPQYGTNSFIFTLRGGNRVFYSAPVEYLDSYQVGYHKMLTYRENCYHCRYARAERVGDLTISDFSGLGRLEPWTEENRSVSCVIPSTPKGRFLLDTLQQKEKIQLYRRPAEEAYRLEKQLRGPSAPNVHRKEFLKLYSEGNGFDASVQCACKKEMQRYFVIRTLHVKEIRLACRKLVPTKLKKIIKKGAKYFSA